MKNTYDEYDRALTGIVIDPGHGGADSGASGNGIIEKNMTLDISNYMYNRFKELGVPVAMSRTTDEELTSATRPGRILNAFGGGKDVIVLSNHINAGGGEGAEVIYALRNSDALSGKILNSLAQEGQTIRKNYQRRLPSNPAKDYYYVLRETPNTEAVIVEYGFLDNAKDAAKLKANYKDYAEAVVRAVMDYKNLPYTPPTGSTSEYYVVKAGDTLWNIAKKYGISVDELKSLNNLTSNTLTIGQTLKVTSNNQIPSTPLPSTENYYTVKKGDSLYAIANKYGMTVNELKSLNNLTSNNLSIGQKLIIKPTTPSTGETTHTVKAGDTLYAIARTYGTTVDAIKQANNMTSNTLTIGRVLIIPTESLYNTYTVKPGDTLYGIAMANNTTVDKIKDINNLTSNMLSIGQKLLIP